MFRLLPPLFLVMILLRVSTTAADEAPVFPMGLCLIPEMDFIPEVDGWTPCKPDQYPDQVRRVTSLWKDKSDWVQRRITGNVVRELSRWAKPQMEKYRTVPDLAVLNLSALAIDSKHHKIVFAGTIDTLPSHSPLVTRWLKLFLLCDEETGEILRATITIRGEAHE